MTPDQQLLVKESKFTYSKCISLPQILIRGGNLHWHKRLPNTTYTLETATIEIYNFGNIDIVVDQMELKVDTDRKLFNINRMVPARTVESVVVYPEMEGYNGGTHIVSVALLDEKNRILYESSRQEMGPLEPAPP